MGIRHRIPFGPISNGLAREIGKHNAHQTPTTETRPDATEADSGTRSQRMPWEIAWAAVSQIPHPGLWLALAIGLYIRLSLVLSSNFPLNDGGMFYTMALDIERNGFALPWYTTYNLSHIPFAYPPLGLYLAAITHVITPLSMLEVTRFLPLVFNVLTIVAVYFLARAMLSSELVAGAAAIAFALLPRGFTWLIVGGGLTRSPALFFSVLGITAIYLFYTRRRWKYLGPATVFAGLAILTHPEVGWFTVFTYAILFLLHGLHKRGFLGSLAAAAGAAAISAPWWGTVIARFGLAPLLSAASTGGQQNDVLAMLRSIAYLNFTEEPYGPIFAALIVLGVFAAIAKGNLTLPLWFVLMFILEPRSARTYASIPGAMLIALLLTTVIVPGLRRLPWASAGRSLVLAGGSEEGSRFHDLTLLPRSWIPPGLLIAFLLTYGIVSAVHANAYVLRSVPQGDRAAMQWVAQNTPKDSTFVVVSYSAWATDKVGEWFPALTGRQSVATVQGTEWLGRGIFAWSQVRYSELVNCAYQDLSCLATWESYEPQHPDYVYLSQGCCGAQLILGLQDSSDYRLVYGTPEVGIWKYVPTAPG